MSNHFNFNAEVVNFFSTRHNNIDGSRYWFLTSIYQHFFRFLIWDFDFFGRTRALAIETYVDCWICGEAEHREISRRCPKTAKKCAKSQKRAKEPSLDLFSYPFITIKIYIEH